MDLQNLVAAHMLNRRRPQQMDASAEDRYYSDQIALPRPGLRMLAPVAAVAGVILLLVGLAQI